MKCSLIFYYSTLYTIHSTLNLTRPLPYLQGRLEDLQSMTLPNSKQDLSGLEQNGNDIASSRLSMASSRANMTSSRATLTSTPSNSSRGSVGMNREAVKLYCDDNVFKYIQITEETTALELVYIGLDQVGLFV